MGLSLQQIETALETGLDYVTKLAPLAALGGPAAAAIGNIVATIASEGETILSEVSGDASIIAGGDLTKITALQAQLQQQNAQLAQQIAGS